MNLATHDRLLEALATSGDVAPWSVYADLLQTHGDPRGELITLMLERERHPTKPLFDAQRRLLDKHGAALVPAALADRVLALRRGFVADLRIDAPAQFAELDDPALRFVDSATLVIDGEQWDEWREALASRTLPWRRLRITIENAAEPIQLAPIVRAFSALETLRITCAGDPTIAWDEVRAARLRMLALVDGGDVASLDDAELPQLRELRLLGESMATDALCASLTWSRLEHVMLAYAPQLEATGGPNVHVMAPVERDVDRESNAFMVVDAPIELALLHKLVVRMTGVQQLSVRLAQLRWVPRPFTVIQLYGIADADLPYGLAVALDAVLSPAPPIALVELDEVRGRFLVLGKTSVRGELDDGDELVRRVVDLTLGCDPGSAILEDVLDELAAASEHILVGDGRSHTVLNVIDPAAAPLIEPENYEDEDEDEDDEYSGSDDWDDEVDKMYEEPPVLVDEVVADLETSAEVDAAPSDDDREPLEPTEHDALDRPEVWFEFRDHWGDRASDPDDEPDEVRMPDPEHVANELVIDLDRQVAAPACTQHGCVLEECRWCAAPLCVECMKDSGVEGACATCAAELERPLPPPPPPRTKDRTVVSS